MTQELTGIRRGLARVSSDLKQDRILPAAKAVQAAARAVMRLPLLKGEQEEFHKMIADACVLLQNNKELRRIFPLAIAYTPKEEAQLVETLTELIGILESEAASQVQEGLQNLKAQQNSALEKGRQELSAGQHDSARQTFKALSEEFSEDGELITEIGESFLQAGLFDDATTYFTQAAVVLPESAHVLNRLGIALRKLGRFDAAEEKFRMALSIEKNDPNLYFNLGRLYLDSKRWTECMACAQAALNIEPSFTQASQMIAYCARMLKE